MRIACVTLAAAAGMAWAQPNLVSNGDFEAGNFSGWTQFGDMGFTAVGTTAFGPVHAGTYSAHFGPTGATGGIQQTLAATNGQQALVDFWYSAVGTNNSFTATLGSQTLVSLTNDTRDWTRMTFLVTVDQDNPVLSFTFFNPPNYDYLDDVHVYTSGFGACCLGDASCVPDTGAGCAAAGGVYRGDGTSCASIVCPSGACCLANQTCTVTGAGGCSGSGGVYMGDQTICAQVNCPPVTFVTVPLNWNFNGMVHGAAEQGTQNRDNPNGYRSVADRGLMVDGSGGTINAGPIIDPGFMPFSLVSQPGVLDIVCLGDRRYVANAARNWGTNANNGLQPSWLPNSDLTGPQVSNLTSLNAVFGPGTVLGVLYQVSDGGGKFDMVLTFTDNSSATVTLRGPDWYGDRTPPAPGLGVAAQRKLGVYTSTDSTDIANLQNPLNVTEAVITTTSLQNAGLGNFSGKQLASITFQNPVSNTTTYANSTLANASGYAIIAATLGRIGGTAPVCYPNCDHSTVPPCLNVQDFSCFLNKFATGDSYANCDASTIPPVLNVQDFSCFLNRFSSGCSFC